MPTKQQFYLKCGMMGSCLSFHKATKKYSKVYLDNGETAIFSKGRYFQPVIMWDTIHYTRFETKKDCLKYIDENFDRLKDWDIEANKLTKEEFLKVVSKKLTMPKTISLKDLIKKLTIARKPLLVGFLDERDEVEYHPVTLFEAYNNLAKGFAHTLYESYETEKIKL